MHMQFHVIERTNMTLKEQSTTTEQKKCKKNSNNNGTLYQRCKIPFELVWNWLRAYNSSWLKLIFAIGAYFVVYDDKNALMYLYQGLACGHRWTACECVFLCLVRDMQMAMDNCWSHRNDVIALFWLRLTAHHMDCNAMHNRTIPKMNMATFIVCHYFSDSPFFIAYISHDTWWVFFQKRVG